MLIGLRDRSLAPFCGEQRLPTGGLEREFDLGSACKERRGHAITSVNNQLALQASGYR